MNTTALVDRLNFAYQLTTGKYAGQKFDSPKLLAMGLLTPSAVDEVMAAGSGKGAAATPAGMKLPVPAAKLMGVADTGGASAQPAAPLAPLSAGTKVAMRVLEASMIGGQVSAQTNQLIELQLQQQPAQNPADTLNLLTALVMGSPEFQLR
jgi:hypothetical protein